MRPNRYRFQLLAPSETEGSNGNTILQIPTLMSGIYSGYRGSARERTSETEPFSRGK